MFALPKLGRKYIINMNEFVSRYIRIDANKFA